MATKYPKPPDLGPRGARFWRAVVGPYDFEPDEVELVVEVARLLDTADGLSEALRRDGYTTTGSTGQVVAHPAVAALTGVQGVLSRLLAQLGLPHEDGSTLASPSSLHAKKAASDRWSRPLPAGTSRADATQAARAARWSDASTIA